MKLEYKRRQIELDLYGEKFLVKFPTPVQLDSFIEETKKIQLGESNAKEIDLMFEMLEQLGLPRSKAKEMEMGHINDLTNVLLEVKKN